jgi:hypothetical protein
VRAPHLFPLLLGLLLSLTVSSLRAAPSTGFIENQGQVDSRVAYYMPGGRASIYFTKEAVVVDLHEQRTRPVSEPMRGVDPLHDPTAEAPAEPLRGCAVYIRFKGANPSPRIEARGELETQYSYFLGNDASRWRSDVPAYAEVVYHNLWPGVDLVLRRQPDGISGRLVKGPEKATAIPLIRYEGATAVISLAHGSCRLETPAGALVGPLEGEVLAEAVQWRCEAAAGNDSAPDPLGRDNPQVLSYSTCLGGDWDDAVNKLVLAPDGCPVVAGTANSLDFPTTAGSYDTSADTTDVPQAFVAKLTNDGAGLIWSTYLGGSGSDNGYGLALDSDGSVVVVGATHSADFPVTDGAFQDQGAGGFDAFVAKLSEGGDALIWSTYLGGSRWDDGFGVLLDEMHRPLVYGFAMSANFPTTPDAFQATLHGSQDGFVAKLSADATELLWSTLFGGGNLDEVHGAMLDPSGDPVLIGDTNSADFPTTAGAYDRTWNGNYDAYVAELTADGTGLAWSTYLGGAAGDLGHELTADEEGALYVCGRTSSADFPATSQAFDQTLGGSRDAFIVKMDAAGSGLIWSTFFGGSGQEDAYGLAFGGSNLLLAGTTSSPDMPITARAYDGSYNGGDADVYVAMLGPAGDALLWSTYLGGSESEVAIAVCANASGDPVIAGATWSADFPTTPGAFQPSFGGVGDGYVACFDPGDLTAVPDGESSETAVPTLHLASAPNPLGALTTLRWTLAEHSRTSITIFAADGRLIRFLGSWFEQAGSHATIWDGRDQNGRPVGGGTYFARLVTDRGCAVVPLVSLGSSGSRGR